MQQIRAAIQQHRGRLDAIDGNITRMSSASQQRHDGLDRRLKALFDATHVGEALPPTTRATTMVTHART